jgi:hypothetical protein
MLLGTVVPGLWADEPGAPRGSPAIGQPAAINPRESSALGQSATSEAPKQSVVDQYLYGCAARVPLNELGYPVFGRYSLTNPEDGQPIVTVATFEPGVVLEITPDPDKLRAVGVTVEDLRDACRYRRLISAPQANARWGVQVETLAIEREGGAGWPVFNRRSKMIDLATVAAVRKTKMEPKTIPLRLPDGRGLRITPDVEKIGPYLITLEDFHLNLLCHLHLAWLEPTMTAPKGQNDSLVFKPSNLNIEKPGKALVLGGVRVLDSRVPHYRPIVWYGRVVSFGVPEGKENPRSPFGITVHESLGVPLESVARVEVMPARKLHGIMVDPFVAKPEEDFIVWAAGVIEAVQSRVKADPILRPIANAKMIIYEPSLRSRALGVADKDQWRWVEARAETAEVSKSPQNADVAWRGSLIICVSVKPSAQKETLNKNERADLGPLDAAPASCWWGRTNLSTPGTVADVHVATLTSDRGAHRRLIGILMEESAKTGLPLKAMEGSALDSFTLPPLPPDGYSPPLSPAGSPTLPQLVPSIPREQPPPTSKQT